MSGFSRPESGKKALAAFLKRPDTGRPAVHGLLQTLMPVQEYQQLAHRYYPEMLSVQGGPFEMGSTDGHDFEKPPHKVTLADYELGATPVTFYQFGLYCAATGRSVAASTPPWGKSGTHPVVLVSWYEAVEYLNWLSDQYGYATASTVDKTKKDPANQANDIFKWLVGRVSGAGGFRLPTEAEWEYGARGGRSGTRDKAQQTQYAGSDDLDAVGWYWKNSGDQPLYGDYDSEQVLRNNGRTHPCRLKKPNPLGLYDMSGNVYEWCWDWYDQNYYKNNPVKNPLGADSGSNRVLRGGAWYFDENCCRVAFRDFSVPGGRYFSVGFRPARTVKF